MEYIYNAILQVRLWFYTTLMKSKLITNVPPYMDGRELIFSDEFDSGVLDRNKWQSLPNWGCRVHPDNPTIALSDDNIVFGSDLELMVKVNKFSLEDCGQYYDIDHTIALIENFKFSQQLESSYGYYEIRCKIPEGVGMWPAFWLWGINSWPPEIDVFEFWTTPKCNWFNSNYHWSESGMHKQAPYTHRTPTLNLSKGFHRYGLDWSEKTMKFYFDGILVRKISTHEPNTMRIVINSGLDIKKIVDADLPSTFSVDWVRYYGPKK